MSMSRRTAAILWLSGAASMLYALLLPTLTLLLFVGMGLLVLGGVSNVVDYVWPPDRKRVAGVNRKRNELMSSENLDADCRERMAVTPDPLPELPIPLPTALRDPGFARESLQKINQEIRELRETIRRSNRQGLSYYYRSAYYDRIEVAKSKRDTLAARPFVAERAFEGHTHCPRGHVGTHHIGEAVNHRGVRHVRRVCCYAACAVEWLERAFGEAESTEGGDW